MNNEEKRFHAAVAAMQAIITGDVTNSEAGILTKQMADRAGIEAEEVTAKLAIAYADALLAELDRTKPEMQLDADGWIPHVPGDPMPCDEMQLVFVKLRNGTQWSSPSSAGFWNDANWSESNWNEVGDTSIIAWKPA